MKSEKDKILASLVSIEKFAAEIDAEMESKKAGYAVELDERIKDFDARINAEKDTHLDELRDRLSREKKEELLKMRTETLELVGRLDEQYAANHSRWAREIFEQIIEQ